MGAGGGSTVKLRPWGGGQGWATVPSVAQEAGHTQSPTARTGKLEDQQVAAQVTYLKLILVSILLIKRVRTRCRDENMWQNPNKNVENTHDPST